MKFNLGVTQFLILMVVITACGIDESEQNQSLSFTGDQSTVFEEDNRKPMTSSDFPWSTVGRLKIRTGENTFSNCTGTLVAPDLVLTNRHCILDDEDNLLEEVEFTPNYSWNNLRPNQMIRVKNITYNKNGKDWAVLRLEESPGLKLGWLKVKEYKKNEILGMPITMAGYSGDYFEGKFAGVHKGCRILSVIEKKSKLHHDCDSTGGSSGSALMNDKFEIIGVHAAHYIKSNGEEYPQGVAWNNFNSNIGVMSKEFIHLLEDVPSFNLNNVVINNHPVSEKAYPWKLLKVCNQSDNHEVDVLIVNEVSDNFKKSILWNLKNKDGENCHIFKIAEEVKKSLILAKTPNGVYVGDDPDNSFCLNRDWSELSKSKNCESRSKRKYILNELKLSKLKLHTFNLK